MATQTLEFSAGTGLTLSCKLFAIGSDTVVATQTATEKTNDKNRYSVAFTDIAAGAYRLNAFVGSTGGFANEVYDLTLATATFQPRSEATVDLTSVTNRLPAALVGGRMDASVGSMAANTLTASALATDAVAEIAAAVVDGGDAQQATLLLVKAKTDLITSQSIFVTVDRVNGSTITMYYNESTSVTVPIDEDTTSKTLRFVIENAEGTDVLVIENANITRTATDFTVTVTTAVTATLGQYRWALRDITGGTINRLVEGGVMQVVGAANKDA